MKNVKRLSLRALSLLLTLLLVLSTVPMTVFATEADSADETKALPQAEVTKLEPLILASGEYSAYGIFGDGDTSTDRDRQLQAIINFKATQTFEEAQKSAYAKYACDFYLTFSGIENGSFIADNSYLAGNYGDYNWIVIPTDGIEVKEGAELPIVSHHDAKLTYENICDYVRDFTAAIYIAPEILEANPDLTVTLALKMKDPTTEELLTIGEPAVYTVADLSLQSAINTTENGGTIKLENDVTLLEGVTVPAGKEITLDLNGHTVKQSKECTASYEMINNKGKLTITGNGKISFTDTSAGDPSFGWGSYTVRNEGTLVVENGTIEHLGEQNAVGKVVHMYCAIFQYSGSTTINGGTISTPTYRSVRLWQGDMTINGGTFEGQVWVQCVNDTAELTINGGSFAPKGVDGSSVFVGNIDQSGKLHDAKFSVTGGNFSTKIGANNADVLAGAITGGTFTESAKTNTNSALIAEGYEFVENNGKYVVIASDIKEVVDNTEFGDENAEVIADAKAELEKLGADVTTVTSEIKVGLSNVTTDGEGKVTSITFDVTPQLVAGEHSVKISTFEKAITFRLPVPASVSEAYAKIYHEGEYIGTYAIEEDENGKYVEVSSKTFSEYSAEFVDLDLKGEVNGAFTSVDGSIWGDWSGNASESFVIKFYSGDTYMGYTSLDDSLINGEYKTLTWHINLDPKTDTDECWESAWDIKPTLDCMPTTAALYIDGVYIGETEIQLNGPDSISKLYAAVADADGVITGYAYTLQNAFDAVEEGGTILLVRDVTITKDTKGYTDGTWVDGVKYTGDKSFTVDFNGYTVTDDGCINDYVIYINNKGSKANEITFKNGTITTEDCYAVVCVGSKSQSNATTLNLNGMKLSAKNNGGYDYGSTVVRARGNGTVLNVNSGTEIVSDNMSYGVASLTMGTTLNIYDGVKITQQNSANAGGNHTCTAVGGMGEINIYGGTIVSDASGVHTATTETPVINIYGGTITAEGKALVASTNGGTGELATIKVFGGTINGELDETNNDSNILVSGGTFTTDVSDFCEGGFKIEANEDGTYGVVEANYVAEVNGTKYETLAEAFANANGYTVKLLADIATDKTITIASGAVVTLDLNGYTITGTDTTTKNFGLFNNVGTFTVKDSVGGGKITLTATNDNGWDRYSAVISNNPGGNLTIESGIIEHLGGTRMAYGIDNLTNGKGTSAVVTVNGGTVISAYIGIRQFLNGIEATNKLTINGGTVTGANSSIYFQSPSAQANTGTLIIGGEAEIGKRIYLGITDGTTEWPVEISIDSAALAEGVEIVSDPIPEGYEIKTENGVIGAVKVTYVAEVNGTKYETLAEAFANANGYTVKLLADIATDTTITIADGAVVTLDLNGYTITVTDNATGNFELFYIRGEMTVMGEGSITLTATNNREWNYLSAIFHNRGGVLTIKSGSFTHMGGTDMAFAIDNSANSYGDAVLNIEGGTIRSEHYIAIRMRMENPALNGNPGNGISIINVSGGYIFGANRGIWGQKCTVGNEKMGELTVTGGTVENTNGSRGAIQIDTDNLEAQNVYATVSGDAVIKGNVMVSLDEMSISGGTFTTDVSDYCAEGFKVEQNDDGTYGVKLGGAVMIGDAFYASVTEALDYIFENDITGVTIKLITDTEIARGRETIPHGITLDLNGYTLTTRYLSVDGCIIDSSEAKTGLLVIAKDNLTIRDVDGVHTHTYMPVYNEEGTGYIFVEIKAQIDDVVASDDGTNISFEFRPGFIDRDTTKAYFSDGAADNGLTFEVHATWSNGEKDNKIVINEELIQSVYQGDKMISFTLSNVSTEITDLTLSVVIVSESGVIISTVAYPPVNA